jgi:hypothetical protein
VDSVIARHEVMWQASKQEALQAMSTGFSDRMRRMREELAARETTVSSITKYFEQLVADLTDRAHRDPKTRLMNFRRFIERLEQFPRNRAARHWCAVGLVDIRSFKSFNDTFGHALGDRIIERVARLLCEQIRAQDIVAGTARATRLTSCTRASAATSSASSSRISATRATAGSSPSGSAPRSSAMTGRARTIA